MELKKAVFNFLYFDECTEISDDMAKLSPEEYTEYEDLRDEDEALISHLPIDNFLRTRTIVKTIHWNIDCGERFPRVVIETLRGTLIMAKTAIVTLPLGVLKANTVTFVPPLPDRKLRAIDRLGFGCVVKIFLFFQRQWWSNHVELNALFLDSIPDNITVIRGLYRDESDSLWYRDLVGFNSVYGNELVLQSWAVGQSARTIERLPTLEVTSVLNQILLKAFQSEFDVQLPYRVQK